MIITLFIYVTASLFGIISTLLPDFQVFPSEVFNGISWFTTTMLELNSIFLVVPIILNALVFLLKFISYFLLYKISIKAINYLRGSNSL